MSGRRRTSLRSTTYLVEHYWPGLTTETFRETAERVRATAEAMAHAGTAIRYLHSTMVPADEAAFCVLDADSMELVEQLYSRAGIRFDRIVAALDA
jgi:uncharacterized protein with GYD domain